MTAPLEAWPPLPYAEWKDTLATLHRWSQVAGKIRLALAPPVNHWWHVVLYVTARGLSTSPMPYGGREVELIFGVGVRVDGAPVARLRRGVPGRPRHPAEDLRVAGRLEELGGVLGLERAQRQPFRGQDDARVEDHLHASTNLQASRGFLVQ